MLFLMLIALSTFSIFPIVSSIAQQRVKQPAISQQQNPQLEEQAHGYELVLEREPDNQTALQGLLEIRLKQRDLAGSVFPLERLAETNPDFNEYTILLAQTKQQLEDYKGAKEAYETILAKEPDNIQALQGMVNLLIPLEETDTAISLLQKTLNQNQLTGDNLTGVQLLLGQVYALSERYTEAIAIYDQIITANPQDFRPLLAKAIVLRYQGEDTLATSLFTEAAELAPTQYQEQIQTMAEKALEDPS